MPWVLHGIEAAGVWPPVKRATKANSNVEAEVQDIGLAHQIILAFQPQPAGFLGPGFAVVLDEIVERDGLRTNEAPLEISVDYGRSRREPATPALPSRQR